MDERLAELRAEVSEKDEEITTIEENSAAKKEKIATLESETETIQAELDQKSTRVEELEASLNEKEQRIAELEAESTRESEFSEGVLETVRAEAKKTREATTTITGDGGSSGTAWFHEDGYLITNSHVVDGSDSFEAQTLSGKEFEPELLGRSDYFNSPYHDVAVLDVDISPPNTLSIGDSASLEKDQPLFQVGHPGVIGNWVVSIGRFTKRGFGDAVLTSVPTESGSSGSALMTESGKVVGITTGTTPRNGGSGDTTRSEFEIKEEFDSTSYSTHDPTDIITKYVEQFG